MKKAVCFLVALVIAVGLIVTAVPTQVQAADGFTWTIEPQFDWAAEFSEGLAAVEVDGLWGFINRDGRFAIEPQFYQVSLFFDNGTTFVQDESGGQWRTIDRYGNTAQPQPWVSPFGLYVFMRDQQFGFRDADGVTVIEPQFRNARPFNEVLTAVTLDGDLWGFIDKQGNMVIEPQFNDVSIFDGGFIRVKADGLWGLFSVAGKILIEPQFENSWEVRFSEGMVVFEENGLWGYMDVYGNRVIEPQFGAAQIFSEGLAAVFYREDWKFIDKQGNTVIEPIMKASFAAGVFSEGMAIAIFSDGFSPDSNWAFINTAGEIVIILPENYTASAFSEGMAVVSNTQGLMGFISITGASTTPPATTPPPTTATNISTASDWAQAGITTAISAGLVPQTLQNYYTNNITRAEFTALAVLLYETITETEITGRTTFNDTNDINVQKAAYIGIVGGTGGGNFSPNMPFNREQAAVIISRLAYAIGQPFPQAAATFADNAQLSPWAADSVGQVQAANIMGGVGNNIFDPQGTFTREQSIITILRLFETLS